MARVLVFEKSLLLYETKYIIEYTLIFAVFYTSNMSMSNVSVKSEFI